MERRVSWGHQAGMVTLTLCMLWILLTASVNAPAQGPILIKDTAGSTVGLYKESHALVIGVSNYTEGWPPLPGVKEDLQAIARVLEQNGFQVVIVENPDHTALPKAYQDFLRTYGLDPENRLLFYFAGHGYTRKPSYATNDPQEWMGYIVPRDAPLPARDFSAFQAHAMSMQEFDALAQKIEAKHALFVFDSCFSGAIFALSRAAPLDISLLTTQAVRQFISSGSADQDVPDKSEFRRQFIAALEGEADHNHDGYVTGSELGAFLYETVTNYSHGTQTPQYGKIRHPRLDRGDFVFPLALTSNNPPPPLVPPQPSQIRGEQGESPPPPSRPLRGHLQVNVNVKDAKVSVNGVPAGTAQPMAPLNMRDLGAGIVHVRVEAHGYKPLEQDVSIAVNQWTQKDFILEPLSAPQSTAKPVPPGRYEVTKTTSLLAAPDSQAAAMQQLHAHTPVNVVATEGDYVQIESKTGKPPGYILRNVIAPFHTRRPVVRKEPITPVSTSTGVPKQPVSTLQTDPRSQEEQERQQQKEFEQDKKLIDEGQQLLQRLLPR